MQLNLAAAGNKQKQQDINGFIFCSTVKCNILFPVLLFEICDECLHPIQCS